MSVSSVSRSARTLGFAAAVTASIPLVLTACAPVSDAEVFAAELHAAADSDILGLPAQRVYEVADTSLITPVGSDRLTRALERQVHSSGSLVLQDGVITEARIGVTIAHYPEATFELTEPTVLRREGSPESSVFAVGTISVNGIQRPGVTVQLTPTSLTEESVEFDVQFTVPDNPLLPGRSIPIDQIAAHLVLDAR